MKKIPTIFKRAVDMRFLLNEIHPDCEWVFAGEGAATRKYDGTCVKIENGQYFKRREIKPEKKAPADFIEEQFDETTGKTVGWVPVNADKENKYHMEAFDPNLPDGTYELIGPKIQGNPEKSETHKLIRHADAEVFPDVPRQYHALAEWFKNKDIEGIVFHHLDGRMAKIKKRDFGLKR